LPSHAAPTCSCCFARTGRHLDVAIDPLHTGSTSGARDAALSGWRRRCSLSSAKAGGKPLGCLRLLCVYIQLSARSRHPSSWGRMARRVTRNWSPSPTYDKILGSIPGRSILFALGSFAAGCGVHCASGSEALLLQSQCALWHQSGDRTAGAFIARPTRGCLGGCSRRGAVHGALHFASSQRAPRNLHHHNLLLPLHHSHPVPQCPTRSSAPSLRAPLCLMR
jgi:hypothetical protein